MRSDLRFTAIDVETTGLDPLDDLVVELAAVRFENGRPYERLETLINPDCPIPPVASAIHGITNRDVQGAPTFSEVLKRVLAFIGDDFIVAHNAAFDQAYLNVFEARWICTMRLARHLWPNAPSHSLQALRYWLDIPLSSRSNATPHTACGDALLAGLLFSRQIELISQRMNPVCLSRVAELAQSPLDQADKVPERATPVKLDSEFVIVLQEKLNRRARSEQ